MSRTLNTAPFEVQQQNGRVWWNTVSQHDLRMRSTGRKIENRSFRAKSKQALRNGDFDDIPKFTRGFGWW